MDRLISEQELLRHFDPREDWVVVQTIKTIPSAEPSGDLISRSGAIKTIEERAKQIKNEDTLNGLAGAVAILFELPSVKPQKWTPVSERLPQINEWVLCQCRAGYKVLRLTSYGCYCNDTQEYMDSFVIAWMPLPPCFEPQESEVQED